MRILFVTPEFVLSEISGPCSHTCSGLSKAMASLGHSVTVIAPKHPSAAYPENRCFSTKQDEGPSDSTSRMYDLTSGVRLIVSTSSDSRKGLHRIASDVSASHDWDVIHLIGMDSPLSPSNGSHTVATVYAGSTMHAGRVATPYERISKEAGIRHIPDGLDSAFWNPATDIHIPSRFDPIYQDGKAVSKESLMDELGLHDLDRPLLVIFHDENDASQIGIAENIAREFDDGEIHVLISPLVTETDRLHRVFAAADFVALTSRDPAHQWIYLAAHRYGVLDVSNNDAKQKIREMASNTQMLMESRRDVMRIDTSWERSARQYLQLYHS